MAKYVVVSRTKEKAKELGRRLSGSYLSFLDELIERAITKDSQATGGRLTLNGQDARLRRGWL